MIINPYRFGNPASAYRAAVLADSPTAYWRLGEASGTTAADAVGSYPGTYTASPTLGAAGIFSGDTAATFNGSTQYVDTDALITSLTFSVELWIKTSSTVVECPIGYFIPGNIGYVMVEINRDKDFVSLPGAFAISIQNAIGSIHRVATTLSVGVNDGGWHQVVVTSAPSTVAKLYLDGVVQSATVRAVGSGIVPTGTLSLPGMVIGARGVDASSPILFLNGSMDEVAIYPTVLSAARILAHYNASGR